MIISKTRNFSTWFNGFQFYLGWSYLANSSFVSLYMLLWVSSYLIAWPLFMNSVMYWIVHKRLIEFFLYLDIDQFYFLFYNLGSLQMISLAQPWAFVWAAGWLWLHWIQCNDAWMELVFFKLWPRNFVEYKCDI